MMEAARVRLIYLQENKLGYINVFVLQSQTKSLPCHVPIVSSTLSHEHRLGKNKPDGGTAKASQNENISTSRSVYVSQIIPRQTLGKKKTSCHPRRD